MRRRHGVGLSILALVGAVAVFLLSRPDDETARTMRAPTSVAPAGAAGESAAGAERADTDAEDLPEVVILTAPPPRADAWTLLVDVVDESNSPIRASCRFLDENHGQTIFYDFAEQHGPARLEVYGSGALLVYADREPEPFAPGTMTGLTRPASGERRVRVQLDAGLSITGVVLDWDRRTPARASVRAVPIERPVWLRRFELGRRAHTNDQGHFKVSGLLPGRYRLDVRPGPGAAGDMARPAPEVEAGVRGLQVVLSPRTRLTMEVIDAETKRPITTPARIFEVGEEEERGVSFGTRGVTLTRSLKPGSVRRFRAEADGYAPSRVIDVRLGADEMRPHVSIALAPDPGSMASLVLELRDDNGDRVQGPVMIQRVWKGGSTGAGHRVRDGKVRIALPAGTHRLRVEQEGHNEDPLPMPLLPKEIEVTLGREDERTLEVTLERGAWVVARVDENLLSGEPRVPKGENGLGEFVPIAADRWVALVEAKPCTVWAKYRGHGSVEVSLEPARGKTHTVDVRPKPRTVK